MMDEYIYESYLANPSPSHLTILKEWGELHARYVCRSGGEGGCTFPVKIQSHLLLPLLLLPLPLLLCCCCRHYCCY
eukprot:COSAG05_NODE_166_length_15185_cov_10.343497_11_plen_76_part_00